MGLRVRNEGSLKARLEQMGGPMTRRIERILKRGAKDIQKLARRQAPRDKGNLEKAIKIRSADKSWTVYVDTKMPAPAKGEPNKVVGDYLDEMEGGIPGKDGYNLGPKSRAKQEADPSVQVGVFFFERSVGAVVPQLRREMKKASKK